MSYLKKNPKTEEAILKSNSKIQKRRPFKLSYPFNRNNQNKRNRVNNIDDEEDTKEQENENEQEQYQDDTNAEDLCHIDATEYEED
eukprot:1066083-Ditylum_brightwellii.AAC.1